MECGVRNLFQGDFLKTCSWVLSSLIVLSSVFYYCKVELCFFQDKVKSALILVLFTWFFVLISYMYITHIQYLTISVIYQILNLKGSGVSGELMIKQGVFRHPPSFIPTLPRGCCRRCGSLRVCQMVRRLRRSSPLHPAAVSRVSTRPPTTSTAMDLSSSGLVPLVGGPFLSFFFYVASLLIRFWKFLKTFFFINIV